MKLTKQSLQNPMAVIVVAAMVMLFGIISLFKLPAQLLPEMEKPIITVMSTWPGASPSEIESEIGVPIEEVLAGTSGMIHTQAWNMSNFGFMQLTFEMNTDMTRALVDVISRLNRMRPLPASAQKPQVILGEWNDANKTLIEYYIQQLPSSQYSNEENAQFVLDVILPEIQSLYGVSNVDFMDGSMGASGNQLQITFDPIKAAELGIDIARVPGRIGRSADMSSGFVDLGSRQFTLRIEGKYDATELEGMILEWRDGLAVRLGDIAKVEIAPGRRDGFIYQNGNESFRLSVTKSNGANVLEALGGIKGKMEEYNEGIFAERGMTSQYAFDPSVYINRSINLLGGNLIIGVLFAIGVLWAFLRQWRATFLIALAIPVSLLATFVVLNMTGRSLNVISLAGLAFATGMVLDAAIVVLENIIRLRERGESGLEASDKGASQVWGALLASTATTVAIFIPIMFLDDAEGQLFADLAMTIAIGVSVSLIVAVTILPTAARFWMRELPKEKIEDTVWDRLSDKLMSITNTQGKRVSWVAGLFISTAILTFTLMPTRNYMPEVNRDTVDTFISFPPGINVTAADEKIAQVIDQRLQPYMNGEKEPAIRDYFIWSFPGATGAWLATNPAKGTDPDDVVALVQSEIVSGFPDTFAFAQRTSLFGGFGAANSVELEITSQDLEAAGIATTTAQFMIMQVIPGSTANPIVDPSAKATELRFTPNDRRVAEVGWTRQDLTMVVLELGQGAWLGEYFDGQNRLDIYLKSESVPSPEAMAAMPVYTPLGGVVPLGELATISMTKSPNAIIRLNRKRGYPLTVNAPPGMSLEELVHELKTKVEPAIMGMLPQGSRINYAGSAEDMARALNTLGTNFLMALMLLILIMAALFKSIKDAMLVAISIPLAGVGGVLALRLLNVFTSAPLDLLGMIGFIILLGLVVNNAILLVAQTRIAESRGDTRIEAVRTALRLRLRPIFMSTLTSLFGMLPLLIIPGAGSEIYRGMAAVIVGGMCVSTIFTLILLPSLLQLTRDKNLITADAPAVAE